MSLAPPLLPTSVAIQVEVLIRLSTRQAVSGPYTCPVVFSLVSYAAQSGGQTLANGKLFCFALQVKLGLQEVASELFRVCPYVYTTPDSSAVICFTGYLTNLKELAHDHHTTSADVRRPALADYLGGGPCSLARQSSIERSLDAGALTASVVLHMYTEDKACNEVLLLSELQVCVYTLACLLLLGGIYVCN